MFLQREGVAVAGSESGHVDNEGQGSEAGDLICVLCFGFRIINDNI